MARSRVSLVPLEEEGFPIPHPKKSNLPEGFKPKTFFDEFTDFLFAFNLLETLLIVSASARAYISYTACNIPFALHHAILKAGIFTFLFATMGSMKYDHLPAGKCLKDGDNNVICHDKNDYKLTCKKVDEVISEVGETSNYQKHALLSASVHGGWQVNLFFFCTE